MYNECLNLTEKNCKSNKFFLFTGNFRVRRYNQSVQVKSRVNFEQSNTKELSHKQKKNFIVPPQRCHEKQLRWVLYQSKVVSWKLGFKMLPDFLNKNFGKQQVKSTTKNQQLLSKYESYDNDSTMFTRSWRIKLKLGNVFLGIFGLRKAKDKRILVFKLQVQKSFA